MSSTTRLQSFKSQLRDQGSPLVAAFDEIERRVAQIGWKVAYFDAPAPMAAGEREDCLAALEARFGGKIPAEIRESLSDFYALADGFSVVFGPAELPDPMDLSADSDEWAERGAIGYMLLPLERTLQWIEPFAVAGTIRQLSTSDFAAGIKPDTGVFRYSSYLALGDDDDETLDPTTFMHESYETHSIAMAAASSLAAIWTRTAIGSGI